MKVFTYSEARQNLSKLLLLAQKEEVEIRRRDGTIFSLTSKKIKSINWHFLTQNRVVSFRHTFLIIPD